MRKNIIFLLLIILVIGHSSISLAKVSSWDEVGFEVGNYELTNVNTDNPKLSILSTVVYPMFSDGEEDFGYWETSIDFNFEELGINLHDYEVVSSRHYTPSNFSFSTDNLIRSVTKYSKTKDDFDRYYNSQVNNVEEYETYMADGSLHISFIKSIEKKHASFNLKEYYQLPGSEESIIELYQLGNRAEEFIKNTKANKKDGYEYSQSHLFTESLVIELEKKSTEMPVPAGDFIKALNEAEFVFLSHRYDNANYRDLVSVWENIVDEFNNYYLDTKWTESYMRNEHGDYGVVTFEGTQPTDINTRHMKKDVKWNDKKVYAEFLVPYNKKDGYTYVESTPSSKSIKSAYINSFKQDGVSDPYMEGDFWLYMDPSRQFMHYYNDGRIEIIK